MNPRNRIAVIAVAICVVALLAALVAFLLAGDGDDGDAGGGAGSTPSATDFQGDVQQNQPVEVVGTPLVSFDATLATDPAVGTVAPVLEGASFDGTPISIGGPSDDYTLAVFLAHWCPHCNAEVPELNALRDAGTLPDDLEVVGVSTAVASDRPNYPPSEWIVDKDWTWPVLADDENATAFQAYGGSGFPFLVILDPDGNVVVRKSGEDSAANILAWIEESLGTTTD